MQKALQFCLDFHTATVLNQLLKLYSQRELCNLDYILKQFRGNQHLILFYPANRMSRKKEHNMSIAS